jgi:ankyrin repeat protein
LAAGKTHRVCWRDSKSTNPKPKRNVPVPTPRTETVIRILLAALVCAGFLNPSRADNEDNPFTHPSPTLNERPLDLQLQQACTTDKVDRVGHLLDEGASIDSTDAVGDTPLIFAAMNDQKAVVDLLLARGAKIDVQDSKSCTALDYACAINSHDIAMELVDKGANCNLFDQSGQRVWPMTAAARYGDIALLSALIDHKGDINRASVWGTPLASALFADEWDAFNFRISKGADPNIPDSYQGWGRTPLISAARRSGGDNPQDALVEVQALLKVHANPNLMTKSGTTALMYACANGSTEIVQALLDAGADVNAIDCNGDTALIYAADRGNFNLVTLMKDHGATLVDPHIIARPKPSPPFKPPQAWALAIEAMYCLRDGTNFHSLTIDDPYHQEEEPNEKQQFIRSSLADKEGIENKADLLNKLKSLLSTGDRAAGLKEGKRLAKMSDADFDAYVGKLGDAEAVVQAKAERKSFLRWKSRSGLAFDLCYCVRLVSYGAAAGYLNSDEAWPLLAPVAQMAQQNFGSWEEFGENFLDGREIVKKERDPVLAACVKMLCNPKDPNSPWNECPWDTDLTAGNTYYAYSAYLEPPKMNDPPTLSVPPPELIDMKSIHERQMEAAKGSKDAIKGIMDRYLGDLKQLFYKEMSEGNDSAALAVRLEIRRTIPGYPFFGQWASRNYGSSVMHFNLNGRWTEDWNGNTEEGQWSAVDDKVVAVTCANNYVWHFRLNDAGHLIRNDGLDYAPEGQVEAYVTPAPNGCLWLEADDADLQGSQICIEEDRPNNIGFWINLSDSAAWQVRVGTPGDYLVLFNYALDPESKGSVVVLGAGNQRVTFAPPFTTGWTDYQVEKAGKIHLNAGPQEIDLTATKKPGFGTLNLRFIVLVPMHP